LSGGVTVLASILVVSMPQFLLHIFLDDHVIIQIGVHYLRIVGGCYIFFAIMFASNGIINGAGHTLVTTIISLIGLWIVRVPLAHFLAHRIGDETGIWIAISVSFLVAMVCSCSYFFSGRWKKSIHRKIPENPAFDPLAPVDNETL
jgi:Na+-driven multidrug efflux pump